MVPKVHNFKLAIGLPLSFPMVPSGFFFSFARLERPDYVLLPAVNGPIDVLRNNIVEDALRIGCSHLIMMDTDMTYHPQTIPILLSHKLPVVGVMCFRRYPPFDPIMYRGIVNKYQTIMDWDDGELTEVDATGTGCLMFDMSVFRKLPRPWFRFRFNDDKGIGGIIGEDIGFCGDLKRAGYKIYVDTSIPAGHLSTMEINQNTWEVYKVFNPAYRERLENKEVIDNVC